MPEYLLQEADGSRFTLEDGTGFLLLEALPSVISRRTRIIWENTGRRVAWGIARRVRWR